MRKPAPRNPAPAPTSIQFAPEALNTCVRVRPGREAARRRRTASFMRSIMSIQLKAGTALPSRQGRAAVVLLIAALILVAIGGLTIRLGPRWPRRLLFRAPAGIIIHHTATGSTVEGEVVDVSTIDRWHEQRGFSAEYRGHVYHVGYHYVILPDGTVQQGRPEWMIGAHTSGFNDHLGICLVGNFDSRANPNHAQQPAVPTEAQMDALYELLEKLMAKYRFEPEDIRGHNELGCTACPGDRFPIEELREKLRTRK